MKKLFLCFIATALVSLTSCKEKATDKINQENVEKAAERDAQDIVYPVVTFDKLTHDFGEIQNGTPVETVFTYTNSGRSPLVVTDIKVPVGVPFRKGGAEHHFSTRRIVSVYSKV